MYRKCLGVHTGSGKPGKLLKSENLKFGKMNIFPGGKKHFHG